MDPDMCRTLWSLIWRRKDEGVSMKRRLAFFLLSQWHHDVHVLQENRLNLNWCISGIFSVCTVSSEWTLSDICHGFQECLGMFGNLQQWKSGSGIPNFTKNTSSSNEPNFISGGGNICVWLTDALQQQEEDEEEVTEWKRRWQHERGQLQEDRTAVEKKELRCVKSFWQCV